MARKSVGSSEKKEKRSRKMRDLPAKPVGARKAAGVTGGGGNDNPTESLSLNFTTVHHTY